MNKCVPCFQWDLTYTRVRLVMNRHLYGRLHGLALEDVAVTKDQPSCYHGAMSTSSWRARVIGNNLYLHGIIVLQAYGPRGDEASLRDYVQRFDHNLVCFHLRTPRDAPWSGFPIIPELGRDQDSPALFRQISGVVRSCSVCFTDYQIGITLRDPPRSARRGSWGRHWVVTVTRWHNIGECRSPEDPKWCNLVNLLPIIKSVQRRDLCEAGMIRREWMRQDASSADMDMTEGTFDCW